MTTVTIPVDEKTKALYEQADKAVQARIGQQVAEILRLSLLSPEARADMYTHQASRATQKALKQ